MISRRALMGVSAAASAMASVRSAKADAAVPSDPTLAPRGRFGRLERLRTLDLESRMDFLMSFRTFANRDLNSAAAAASESLLGAEPLNPSDTAIRSAITTLHADPTVATSARAWLSCQQLSWNNLLQEFEGHRDRYLQEMAAVDDRGPGTLELNPDLRMPDYVKYEIHIQPGGYVGSEFAGHLYHYGTNGFYTGRNTQDELHRTAASGFPAPADGRVKRILDIGCGIGQLTLAMKERFPDAEVWGLDVSGPMVRYGHLRGVERGIDVNFVQRLAEESGFPADHFDMVVSYIMFHEVDPKGTQDIVREMHRITRPGGVFYPIDFNLRSERQLTPYHAYRRWWDHRWNGERWTISFRENDLPGLIRRAGFDLNEEGPVALPRFGVLNATKPA